MASLGHIRGMMLEEIILFLLSRNGYRVVDDQGYERHILTRENNMLWVKGRGEWHQIDAIADYNFSPPFSYAQRLLVEAKCLQGNVGLDVIRNSVGVHKDVTEFFVPDVDGNGLYRNRYHYQTAVFSANGFSAEAQNYAYAQDIFLLDLKAGPLRPIIAILNRLRRADFPEDIDLGDLRRRFRNFLHGRRDYAEENPRLLEIQNGVDRIGFACVAMIGGIFPLFLIPANFEVLEILLRLQEITCTMHIENDQFVIKREQQDLFYFRLPDVLFMKCFDRGEFNQRGALDMKEEYLSKIEVLLMDGRISAKCTLILDRHWLREIRRSLEQTVDNP